jgi:hypothetical protein
MSGNRPRGNYAKETSMVKLTKPVTVFRLKYTEDIQKRGGARVYGKLPQVTISIESEKIQTEEDIFRLFNPTYYTGARSTFPHPIFQVMDALQKGATKIVIPWQTKKVKKVKVTKNGKKLKTGKAYREAMCGVLKFKK